MPLPGTPTIGSIPRGMPRGLGPITGAQPPFPPTTTQFQPGQLAGLCDLLPDRLRTICLAGSTLFPGGSGTFTPLVAQECPEGSIRLGEQCVAPGDLFPGGRPLVFPADGQAAGAVVQGGFGLPATEPVGVTRVTRRCPRGMVLGIDDLCYAKAILTGRSKLRKWRRPVRPPISRRDTVAITRAASAKERVFELAKDVGLHVSKTPHRRKKK